MRQYTSGGFKCFSAAQNLLQILPELLSTDTIQEEVYTTVCVVQFVGHLKQKG